MVNVIIVGAGPAGLTLGATLAKRGHRILAFDRDPGPAPDGSWRRRGVMQFEHPHGFRPQVRDLLLTHWPEAWQTWRDLGAEPVELPLPDAPAAVGVRSRRSTYERALRRAAADIDGLTVRAGYVDGIAERHGRVVGATVGGVTVDADLVIDAGGQRSRLAASTTTDLSAETGMTYVTRSYHRRPGAVDAPMTSPIAWTGIFDGYHVYVFPHEHGHFSVVIIRPTADQALSLLGRRDAFDAACRAIPGLADWTDPRFATPTTRVLIGGRLRNVYRSQLGRPGLLSVGDSVATTAPTAGRGVAMASIQIRALLGLLDSGAEPLTIAAPFANWCDTWVRPWVEDHLATDGEAVRQWQGHDLDLSQPLTSAAIVAAARADSRIATYLSGYLSMNQLPSSLAPAEPLARAVYASGWRPPFSDGPTRDQLVDLLHATTSSIVGMGAVPAQSRRHRRRIAEPAALSTGVDPRVEQCS